MLDGKPPVQTKISSTKEPTQNVWKKKQCTVYYLGQNCLRLVPKIFNKFTVQKYKIQSMKYKNEVVAKKHSNNLIDYLQDICENTL